MVHTLHLRLDAAPLRLALIRLTEHAAKIPFEVRQRFFDLVETACETAFFEFDTRTTDTGDVIVRLNPSERLAVFVSASGTGNIDCGVFKHI